MFGEDRVEWSYFKGVTIGMGKSFAFMEPHAGLGTRLLRVFQGMLEVRYRITIFVGTRLAGWIPYERRLSTARLRAKIGLLLGRIKRLWRVS